MLHFYTSYINNLYNYICVVYMGITLFRESYRYNWKIVKTSVDDKSDLPKTSVVPSVFEYEYLFMVRR